jgi:hypothetical protein
VVAPPARRSDSELEAELHRAAASHRLGAAALVALLVEFDARRLYRGAGFPSLFEYCCRLLHLSEHEAYHHVEAARTARRFPAMLDALAHGLLNLTTVKLLAPVLTLENHLRLIGEATHQGRRRVEEMVVRELPRPDEPPDLRKLPVRTAGAATGAVATGTPTAADTIPRAGAPPPSPPSHRPLLAPLAPDRYQVRFTASEVTYEKLRLAQAMLRHAVPDGDPAAIVDRALTMLLEDLARKKFAATPRPRTGPGVSAGSREVPAEVNRAVWLRDRGRCAFVAANGRRCPSMAFIEFHHVTPFAAGGRATAENIQLRCRSHNQHEADVYFGPIRSARDVTAG